MSQRSRGCAATDHPPNGAATAVEPDLAAGGVPVREADGRLHVLLIHRPRHDDWTFPKGHLEPGEHLLAAAVREVAEETTVRVRLGPPLPSLAYPLPNGRTKLVRFWLAEPLGDAGTPLDTGEVDRTDWMDIEAAASRLTYAEDRSLIEEVVRLRPPGQRSRALVVLRHAHAKGRGSWHQPDHLRPLRARGRAEAAALTPVLAAYAPDRLVSSNAARCRDTITGYAKATGCDIELEPRLSEQTTAREAAQLVDELRAAVVAAASVTLMCSHRPTLPDIFAALNVPTVALAPGAFVVVHHSATGAVVAVEHHEL